MSRYLKSLATWLFIQQYIQADNKKTSKAILLAFEEGNHQWLVDSPHKGPVKQRAFPCHDVIMTYYYLDTLIMALLWCHMGIKASQVTGH